MITKFPKNAFDNEYYILSADMTATKYPILAWGNTSSRPFLRIEEIKKENLEFPMEIMFSDLSPKKSTMADWLSLNSSFVVSEKIKQLFEKLKLPKLQFFPVAIIKNKKERIEKGYYILHCWNGIPAVDKKNYKGDPVNEKGRIVELNAFALDETQLKKTPLESRLLFCLSEHMSLILVHNSIVEAIQKENPTGFYFKPRGDQTPATKAVSADADTNGDSDEENDDEAGDNNESSDASGDAVYKAAEKDDKRIPAFIEYQRTLGNKGGLRQMEQITDLLSTTDNGLRLLAACCVYAFDNQNLEPAIAMWIPRYVGKDAERQEKLFNYMLIEAAKKKDKKFLPAFFKEALNAMRITYNKDKLTALVANIDAKKLPKFSEIN